MITDENYNWLAEKVYDVEYAKTKANHKKHVARQGTINEKDSQFYVLEAEDNPDTGMQARVVGAIKGGEVSKGYIMIVYAGINHLTAIRSEERRVGKEC